MFCLKSTVRENVAHQRNLSKLLNQKRWSSNTTKSKVTPQYPKVKDTNNISVRVLNLEGLFAGYKPLFLGNGSAELNPPFLDYNEVFDNNISTQPEPKIIPWDASIGGLVYNDDPFKGVPRDVVKKLGFVKPSLPEVEGKKKKPKFIKFKVHNKLVDEGLFDDYQVFKSKKHKRKVEESVKNKNVTINPVNKIIDEININYEDISMGSVFSNEVNREFINEKETLIQYTVDNFKTKLNNDLRKKYETELLSKTPIFKLPKYIFLQRKSIVNEAMLKRKLYKFFLKETDTLFRLSYGYRGTEYNKTRFKRSFMRNIRLLITNLINKTYINVDNFGKTDCLVVKRINKSSNFGKIYWFNPKRRYDIVIREKSEKVYSKDNIRFSDGLITPLCLSCRLGKSGKNFKENLNDYNKEKDAIQI